MEIGPEQVLASYDLQVTRFGYFGFRRESTSVIIDDWLLFIKPVILCVACARELPSMGAAIKHEGLHGIDVSVLESFDDEEVKKLLSKGYSVEVEMAIPRRMQRLCLAHSISYVV
jgi:hypothetical protein